MLEDPSLIFLFSTLICLLIISGFFSGSETGMMAANKIKLRNLSKKSKTSAKRALNLLKRPDQLLSAILVGNNFANILASAIVTIIMLKYFGGNVLLGSIILTIVILIFSEITPKTMATIKPESFATRSSFILNILIYVFKPIIFFTNFLSRLILRLFKLDAKDATLNDNLNTEELKTLLEESGDLIPNQYRKMLSSVLGMEGLVVEDIMIPTSEIIGININEDYENATKIIESTEYTRLPVFEDSIDNMIGILHLKDSHSFLENFNKNNKSYKTMLQKTYFVSQSTLLMKQLREFLANNQSLGLVVDEYGEIEGLISVEDIFKEITGKFGGDKEELEKEFIKLKDGSILTDGNSKIRELNNYLNWAIPEDNAKTINGLVTQYLDQIPQANLCIEVENYRFEVLELDENFISKIKIKKIS
ncbi:MAG: HlyC/CorC family transporter [Gammaproteobacteria bacterium]|jgi:Mg2+/Co2+ transporter CorB|nr:CNNM domain-containing protein [Gammaproteobacteria bacterium]|tara:strand:- start:190 stop:1449 length:1260 start_codon:yes stop_codon:yes gene_type:complete